MLRNLVFQEKQPAASEYVKMLEDAGWDACKDLDALKSGLSNSLYHISVRKSGRLIAMGRVVGDGSTAFFIHDIIVSKEYQNKGIGTKIMNRIMDYIATNATNNALVGLLAALHKESFYKKFNFITRPNESGGSGMMQIYKSSL